VGQLADATDAAEVGEPLRHEQGLGRPERRLVHVGEQVLACDDSLVEPTVDAHGKDRRKRKA
jgi:hypothetical protein